MHIQKIALGGPSMKKNKQNTSNSEGKSERIGIVKKPLCHFRITVLYKNASNQYKQPCVTEGTYLENHYRKHMERSLSSLLPPSAVLHQCIFIFIVFVKNQISFEEN